MRLPGLITLDHEDQASLDRAAHVITLAFLEEPWFSEWLTALDHVENAAYKKREALYASLRTEITELSEYGGVLVTPDFSAVAGGYHLSDLRGQKPNDIFHRTKVPLDKALSADEIALLDKKADEMKRISIFDWAQDEAGGSDFIYFSFWGVDKSRRKSGVFRQLTNPIFQYANNRQIPVYLDCFSSPLQSLYEHVGFKLIEEHKDPALPIYERRMVRPPQSWVR